MLIFQRHATKHKRNFNVYYNYTLQHYSVLAENGLTPQGLQEVVFKSENDARQAIIKWDNKE